MAPLSRTPVIRPSGSVEQSCTSPAMTPPVTVRPTEPATVFGSPEDAAVAS